VNVRNGRFWPNVIDGFFWVNARKSRSNASGLGLAELDGDCEALGDMLADGLTEADADSDADPLGLTDALGL